MALAIRRECRDFVQIYNCTVWQLVKVAIVKYPELISNRNSVCAHKTFKIYASRQTVLLFVFGVPC